MTTIKNCTDLKQSKKLAEFLPLESADMYYANNDINKIIIRKWKDETHDEDDIPAWSLAALMNLLPSEFTEVGEYSTTTYEIHIRKYKFTDEVNLHQIAYGNYKRHEDGGYTWKDMINTGEKEYLLDAAFEMVCWLKENGKI